MAKKKSGVNLSEKIREVLESGVTSPSEVVRSLKATGIDVKIGLVNNVKSKVMKAGGKPKSVSRKAEPIVSDGLKIGGGVVVAIEQLGAIAKTLGGIENAIRVLQVMSSAGRN